jgi:hypothetical protein
MRRHRANRRQPSYIATVEYSALRIGSLRRVVKSNAPVLCVRIGGALQTAPSGTPRHMFLGRAQRQALARSIARGP